MASRLNSGERPRLRSFPVVSSPQSGEDGALKKRFREGDPTQCANYRSLLVEGEKQISRKLDGGKPARDPSCCLVVLCSELGTKCSRETVFPETRVQTEDAWDFNRVGSIVEAQCWHTAAAGPLLSPCWSSVLVMGRMERLPTAPRVWSWVCSSN